MHLRPFHPYVVLNPIYKISKKNKQLKEFMEFTENIIRKVGLCCKLYISLIQEEKRQERIEQEKWKNVPAWKRNIMMEKQKDKKKMTAEEKQKVRESGINQ